VTGSGLTFNGNGTLTGGVISLATFIRIASSTDLDVEGETGEASTLAAALDAADQVVGKPELKDYAETSTTPSSATNVLTLDLENGNDFQVTLTEDITTVTISNPPASGKRGSFALDIIQDSVARTITWPASVKWPGGTAPTLSTGSGDIDSFAFRTRDAGTTWLGYICGQDFS